MESNILTEEDLRPIAEHYTRHGLLSWLTRHGIPYVIAKNGWPRVHRKALERAMGVNDEASSLIEAKPVAFNFEALK